LEDTLDLRKKKTAEVSLLLKARNYAVVDEDADYKYLVRLPMDSVTEENVNKIMQERDRKNADLETLKQTTETQIWLNELAVLRAEFMKQHIATSTTTSREKVKPVKKVKVAGKKE
jgi:hypothetical protein